jgi:biopolymer transport protein ExbB
MVYLTRFPSASTLTLWGNHERQRANVGGDRMDIQRVLVSGGAVMVPLGVFSVAAIALIAERAQFWLKILKRHRPFAEEVMSLYQEQPELVLEKVKRNGDLPLSRIFAAALELPHPTPEEFRLALESETQAELPTLRRFGSAFDTIIAMAPLLGLLGTVTGLITSFNSLNLGDVGGTRTAGVASGISEALISTASGLAVALFVVFFANVFRSLYERQLSMIEEYGGQLELLYRQRYSSMHKQSDLVQELTAAIQRLANGVSHHENS